MGKDIEIKVVSDDATPALEGLKVNLSPESIKREVGRACLLEVQAHLNELGPNKRGWPSSNFYAGAARGSSWEMTDEGVEILVDNAERPGAMRQRFHGGEIHMKDKMLAIPARPEFAGKSPTEFTNLRLAVFANSGTLALVIGKGGVGQVDFATGRERNVKGAGARSEAMVAFWLKKSVNQDPDPDVLPTSDRLAEVAIDAVAGLVAKGWEK